MTLFQKIFDVFSRRPEAAIKPEHCVPESTRRRVVLWCSDVFSNARTCGSQGDLRQDFWLQLHRYFQFKEGKFELSPRSSRPDSRFDDVVQFVMTCRGQAFLDFLEYIFRVESFDLVNADAQDLVNELNELLRVDDLPYHVTNFVKETVMEPIPGCSFQGRVRYIIKTHAYPKVIMRETEVVHALVIAPALQLLQRPTFANVNAEFLAALEDYRKADYADCLTKCGSAFESFMKILCKRKGWPYDEKDTASPLIKKMIDNTALESYFEQPLLIIATLRNRVSSAHGAGTTTRNPPQHFARYAINATASAILLLADETSES